MNADEYMCVVNPCDCSAQLTDLNGREIICETDLTHHAQDSLESSRISLSDYESKSNEEYDNGEDAFVIVVDPSGEVFSTSEQISTSTVSRESVAPASTANSAAPVFKSSTTSPDMDYEFLEPQFEPSPSLKLSLRNENSGNLPSSTRCQSMSAQPHDIKVTCDESGGFSPMQCSIHSQIYGVSCVCVDEAGNQIEHIKPFTPNEENSVCEKVPLKEIDVSLAIPVSIDATGSSRLGIEMQDLLRTMRATLKEDKVDIELFPEETRVHFILQGDNKVDIAYVLETLVKENELGIESNAGEFAAVDFGNSRFHHVSLTREQMEGLWPNNKFGFDSSQTTMGPELNAPTFLDDNELGDGQRLRAEGEIEGNEQEDFVSAQSLGVNENYNMVVVLLTIVAVITAFLAVVGIFLAMQKKKTTGTYPKKPFDSLAFDSQLYEIEKKMPKDFPTFKATPYVIDYKEEEDRESQRVNSA